MTLSNPLRLVLVVGASLAFGGGCGIADAHSSDEVAMSGGTGDRVLGKAAFDAASAGYPPFERLASEGPRRTLNRARAQLAVLDHDLDAMHSRADADDVEFAAATALLEEARAAATDLHERSGPGTTVDELALDEVVEKVQGVQLALDGLRRGRVGG